MIGAEVLDSSIWNGKMNMGINLFYVASLGLIIDLGQPLFPEKSVNLIRSP